MRIIVVVSALVLAAACTKPNPNVCCVTDAQCADLGADELRPCAVGQACAPDFTCVAAQCETSADCTSPDAPICAHNLCIGACTTDDDCAGVTGRPYCSADQTCVGCLDASHCPANAAICDAEEHACRGCERDDECASGVCIEADGVCAEESRVAYVTMFGTDGECTKLSPCRTFSVALSKLDGVRDVIHIIGGLYDLGATTSTITTGTVMVDGEDTTLSYSGPAPMFDVSAGGRVTMERVSIKASAQDTLRVQNNGVLRLYGAVLRDARFLSVHVIGGSLVVANSSVERGAGSHQIYCESAGQVDISRAEFHDASVDADSCIVSVSRSRFINPLNACLQLTGRAVVMNNLFVQDYELTDSVSIGAGTGSVFAFNTVVNRSTVTDSGLALACFDTALTVTSNVFAYNSVSPISPACAARNSLFDEKVASVPAGNMSADVSTFFTDFGNGDYRLGAASPARDRGEPGIVEVDLEGSPRGGMPDIGAFEAP